MTTTTQTIDTIIESAVRWNSDDADNPDTPPQDWQEAIPLLKAAPLLLEALDDLHVTIAATAIKYEWQIAGLQRSVDKARAAIAAATGKETQ